MNPGDADALEFETGDMVRITTESGYFVMRVWRTEGIRPGVVAASHHLGRWRLKDDMGNERWSSALADVGKMEDGRWRLRQKKGIEPFKSSDPDSERIWWSDAGVNQNLAFPPHPDPISGMHAWHQRVRLTAAEADDQYGDVVADTSKSYEVYREWLKLTKPGPGPGGLRRPMWLGRPNKPTDDAYLRLSGSTSFPSGEGGPDRKGRSRKGRYPSGVSSHRRSVGIGPAGPVGPLNACGGAPPEGEHEFRARECPSGSGRVAVHRHHRRFALRVRSASRYRVGGDGV